MKFKTILDKANKIKDIEQLRGKIEQAENIIDLALAEAKVYNCEIEAEIKVQDICFDVSLEEGLEIQKITLKHLKSKADKMEKEINGGKK